MRDTDRGFHLVKGRVYRVGESRKAWWLNLDTQGARPKVAIRIAKKHAHYFSYDIESLKNKKIEARGWMRLIKGELRTNINHEMMIKITDNF